MNWVNVRLVDITNPKQWKNLSISELSEDGYSVYGANGIIGKYNQFNHEFSTIAITCRGATCGSLNITEPKSYITSNAMALDELSPTVDMQFLYYALNRRGFKDVISGSAQPQITREGLSKITLDIPEKFSDQIKIATILSKADELRKQRKESIELLDEVVKSTFIEMFTPYFTHQYSKKLNSLCTKITDGTHDTPERLKKGIKFITGKHIRPYNIDFDNSDYVTEEVHTEIYRRCNPEFGDILYTNIGVNLGTAAMNTVDYEFSMKNVALLKIDKSQISSRYLEHFLNLPIKRNMILNFNSSGGAQQFLSLTQIKNIDISLPPIQIQKKFSEIVEKTEILKTQFKESLIELENLFGSLSQRAFKGELDLSKMEVPIEAQNLNAENEILKFELIENEIPSNAVKTKPAKLATKANTKSKAISSNVSMQQAANWVKEKYTGFHFTSEMLIRFLEKKKIIFPNYFSSEELKKYPQTNEADDIKTFIFSAVGKQNPFLAFEQVFYNAEEENMQFNILEEDYELIKNRTLKNRSGIYFTIV